MIIGAARVTLQIPESQSLKDKRQVVRSLVAQLRNECGVFVSEVEALDRRQIAVLGFAVVSNDGRHADEIMAKAMRFLESRMFEANMLSYETELLHPF